MKSKSYDLDDFAKWKSKTKDIEQPREQYLWGPKGKKPKVKAADKPKTPTEPTIEI